VIQKIEQALKGAYEALSIARQAGVRIGSGSDVLGGQQRKKAFELGYKGKVMSPMEVLIATTMTNAEIVGAQNDLGSIETGKLADLLLVDGNPLDDLSVLADRARIHMVIQGGTIVADRRP
jgi:imidazolonepropionase-like amidohydrolase